MSIPSLWIEKYRPKTLDEYVWQDQALRTKAEEWIKEGALPHLLLSGVSGTGKTSLAKLMLKLLGIPNGDILTIYASRERKVDEVQDRIVNFASTWALNATGFKYVLLDEADSLSQLSQRFLRSEMETYEASCRFILTCNYPQKIIPAIHGRVQEVKFSALDIMDVMSYVDMTYPDLRKCIGLTQQYTQANTLLPPPPQEDMVNGKDYLIEVANLFKNGKYLEARKLIVSQAQVEEYTDIYRYFYKNLNLWGNTEEQQDDALLAIRRGLVNHSVVADPEINLAACLVELSHIAKQ